MGEREREEGKVGGKLEGAGGTCHGEGSKTFTKV